MIDDFEQIGKIKKALANLDEDDVRVLVTAVQELGFAIESEEGVFDNENDGVEDAKRAHKVLSDLLYPDVRDLETIRHEFWMQALDAGFLHEDGDWSIEKSRSNYQDASPPATMLKRLLQMRHWRLTAKCAALIREDALYTWEVVELARHDGVHGEPRRYYIGRHEALRLVPVNPEDVDPSDVADWWSVVEAKPVWRGNAEEEVSAVPGNGPYRSVDGSAQQSALVDVEIRDYELGFSDVMVGDVVMFQKPSAVESVLEALWKKDESNKGRELPPLVMEREKAMRMFSDEV